ncbi:MAG: hypothetical protein AB7V77_03420 [Candidatus Woesearchaeota archaeon]
MFNFKNKTPKVNKEEYINVLNNALNIMNENKIPRITFHVEEIKGQSGFSNMSDYYPEEQLSEIEKKIIDEKKSYQVVSLVLKGSFKENVFPEHDGVEVLNRYGGYALLPGHPFLYHQEGGVWDNISEFVDEASSPDELFPKKYSPVDLKKIIDEEIIKYSK